MKIRVLDIEKDIECFRTIREEAIFNAPESFGESQSEILNKSWEKYCDHLSDHGVGDFVLGAFLEQLIGVVGFYRAQLGNLAHKGTLWGLYVKPEYRRAGVAKALVRSVLGSIDKMNEIEYVKLSVVTDNLPAVALYRSLGFTVYGTEPSALLLNGQSYDEHHMQLKIVRK